MLPYDAPLPADPTARRRAKLARAAVYVLLAAALAAAVGQFQRSTRRAVRKRAQPPGALGRWSKACRAVWASPDANIYTRPPGPGSAPQTAPAVRGIHLHPNMPVVVVLLTPFAMLSAPAAALTFSLLKLAAVAATIAMAASLAGHAGRRVHDWVVALGLAWAVPFVLGDIQHGNTNVFVLAAVTGHLWLYRRGRDLSAGALLALGICLKMTPAIFLLYWLYQRNWKLLAGALIAGLVFAGLAPAVAFGPQRYAVLAETWMRNLILPGLVGGRWYPVHVNQSLSGIVSRYFLAGANGDAFWNPDDFPYYDDAPRHGWITLVALSPAAAKMILRLGQAALVGLVAWAIGWRRLPRDDGRRALHYALVLLAMLLLNQRTWDHHAAVLLPAAVAIWQGIAFGRMSRRARAWALGLVLAAALPGFLLSTEVFRVAAWLAGLGHAAGDHWADLAKAYGTTFYYFVPMLAAGVVLAAALRKSDEPYAARRQRLSESRGGGSASGQ